MSDNESSASDCDLQTENLGACGYKFEPKRKKNQQLDEVVEEMDTVQPVSQWCSCHHCQDMPTIDESICCQDHDINTKIPEDQLCITDCHGVLELLADALLEIAWSSYLCYHKNKFPGGEPTPNAKKRLRAYTNLVFWCWPDIRRKERRLLPSCLVSMVRAMFPPTADEEAFADFGFSGFVYSECDTERA